MIQWCGANHLPQADPLSWKRPAGESQSSQSMTCSCPGVGGDAGILPHGAPHSRQARSSAHSGLPAIPQC
jgi:hypothetical protein